MANMGPPGFFWYQVLDPAHTKLEMGISLEGHAISHRQEGKAVLTLGLEMIMWDLSTTATSRPTLGHINHVVIAEWSHPDRGVMLPIGKLGSKERGPVGVRQAKPTDV